MPHDLPDIKKTRAKGKVYYYFRTGQTTPAGTEILARLPDIKDPSFGDVYASYRAGKARRVNAGLVKMGLRIDG